VFLEDLFTSALLSNYTLYTSSSVRQADSSIYCSNWLEEICHFWGGGELAGLWPFRDKLRRRRSISSTESMKTDNSISSLTTAGWSF
jgi:hypothetical protein